VPRACGAFVSLALLIAGRASRADAERSAMLDAFKTNGSSPPREHQAYTDGYRAGVQDRASGHLSEYAWCGLQLDPIDSYSWW
jgi:hypothetical protein